MRVARGEVSPLPVTTGGIVRELVDARVQVRRFGTLVNQAVAALHSTGQVPVELLSAVGLCARAVNRLDEATAALVKSS